MSRELNAPLLGTIYKTLGGLYYENNNKRSKAIAATTLINAITTISSTIVKPFLILRNRIFIRFNIVKTPSYNIMSFML
ncbi:MAG: hypothetical protein NC084_01750 [Bacteroides sp.]|nr:hypothetical protein [Eubacterium sp.]MCM1417389.1 hypothetical protein [Roseburia sp.]MCM1461418.1 hypothetical protein [Bacteroides sp.]